MRQTRNRPSSFCTACVPRSFSLFAKKLLISNRFISTGTFLAGVRQSHALLRVSKTMYSWRPEDYSARRLARNKALSSKRMGPPVLNVLPPSPITPALCRKSQRNTLAFSS